VLVYLNRRPVLKNGFGWQPQTASCLYKGSRIRVVDACFRGVYTLSSLQNLNSSTVVLMNVHTCDFFFKPNDSCRNWRPDGRPAVRQRCMRLFR